MTKYVYRLPQAHLPFAHLPRQMDSASSSLLLIGMDHWPETVAAGAFCRSGIFGAEGYFRLVLFQAVATHLQCPEEAVLI